MNRTRRELIGVWLTSAAIILGSGLLTLFSLDVARARDLRLELQADAAAVDAVRKMVGVPAAIAVIEARAAAQQPGGLEWQIIDAGMKDGSLAANVPAALLARPGSIGRIAAGQGGLPVRDMLGLAVRLDGGLMLVVARPDVSILHSARGMGIALSVMLLMALAVALVRNRQQELSDRRRIERMGETMTLFLRGDWTLRIREHGEDAIARIAGKTDEMLTLLQQQLGRHDLVAERIAHELRAPMAVLAEDFRTSLEVAPGGSGADPGARAALAAIENLIGLIDAVLLLVGVRENEWRPVRIELDLLLGNIVSLFADAAEEGALTIRLDGSAEPINGEPHLLEMMLVNLVDNAIKYSRPGGVVTLRSDVTPDAVVLTIEDEGPGLAGLPEHPGVLLARGPAGRGLSGSGIGLATAMRIADRHGAKLSFSNRRDGQGLQVSLAFHRAARASLVH